MDETPARRALLAAMAECDLGPDRTARELAGILQDPETSGSLRAKVAMNIAELQGAMPSRKTQVDVNARSQSMRLTVDASLDLTKLQALPPAERRQAVELLGKAGLLPPSEVTDGDEADSERESSGDVVIDAELFGPGRFDASGRDGGVDDADVDERDE